MKSLALAGLLSLSLVAPALADTTAAAPAKPASIAKVEKAPAHKGMHARTTKDAPKATATPKTTAAPKASAAPKADAKLKAP